MGLLVLDFMDIPAADTVAAFLRIEHVRAGYETGAKLGSISQ